ncbi:MAG: hypothetical protein KGJ85_13065 [Betaproteobacteria bacterium]|nr:hypothetical protein [Betaproteobacteria bacterium]MDE2153249.1 hypothetical protein [Betaproteobacteria bacterium]
MQVVSSEELVLRGALVASEEFAAAWQPSLESLPGFQVRGAVYYPAAFLQVPRPSVEAVCQALKGLDAATTLIFFTRQHGALGGRTVQQALQDPAGLPAVLQLAAAWVREQGAPI